MECEHKSLENIHCFKCDKTCLEILAEAKRDMREVTCDARETYEEMSKQLAEARERIEFLEDLVEAVAPDSSAYQDYINQYNL